MEMESHIKRKPVPLPLQKNIKIIRHKLSTKLLCYDLSEVRYPNINTLLKKIQCAAAIDPALLKVKNKIIEGMPNDKCNLNCVLRPYK